MTVRGDKGVENVLVAKYQFDHAQTGITKPYIFGKSVHNQPIERLWRDFRRGVIQTYSIAIEILEREYEFDFDDQLQKYVFHAIFIPRIQQSTDLFVSMWNNHKRRLHNNQTPLQIWKSQIHLIRFHSAKTNDVDVDSIVPPKMNHVKVDDKYAIPDHLMDVIDEWVEVNWQNIIHSTNWGVDAWVECMYYLEPLVVV